MKRNILYILGILVLAVSCIAEQDFNGTSTRNGEVTFAAEMSRSVTKTLYGADNSSSIKVKWVNGDKVKIFGTDCADSRSMGEYQITEAANKPNVDDDPKDPNYNNGSLADALVRLGEVGVQWGSENASRFVAVYPSDNASFNYNGTTVTATTSISAVQNYVFNDILVTKEVKVKDANGNFAMENGEYITTPISVWEGTHFANDATNPTMQNAIMYARTDLVQKGQSVNLTFEPFSTVLKFRFEGFSSLWETENDEIPKVSISSVTITAPYPIAGKFDIEIPVYDEDGGVTKDKPVAKPNGDGSNTITINTIKSNGSFLEIGTNEAVEFNVFTIPYADRKMGAVENENLWKVAINVEGVGTYTYTMKPTANGEYELIPGLIHKVKIPALVSNTPPIWNPENWITQIPKEVYISELSVPGAWYCFDSGYQDVTDLSALYAAGVRAFNIDCRIAKKKGWHLNLGFIEGYVTSSWSDSDYPDNSYLVCAGTENPWGAGGYQFMDEGKYVKDAMDEIVGLANAHPNEYVVVVFTFAEKPCTNSGDVFGSVNPQWIMSELKNVIEDHSDKIYTNLKANTTIKDVISSGKNVIVKINHCTDDFYKNESYTSVIPDGVMGSFASVSALSDYNKKGDLITDIAGLNGETKYENYFTTMRFDNIYNGITSSDLVYCYHQAQYTTDDEERGVSGKGYPTLGMRMDAIYDIIMQSKTVYDNAEHDHWFQMGIGGNIEGKNPSNVTKVLNPYLYGKIVNKMNTDPSPVGIVLMNHATNTTKYTVETTDEVTNAKVSYTASSQDLVKAIIEMNGKFYLNRQGNDVITGDGTQTQELDTKAAAYVGPDAF